MLLCFYNYLNFSSNSSFTVPSLNSADAYEQNEMLNLRNQLARSRNSILQLRQRVTELEKDKRENQPKLQKLAAFEKDPPTYEEFCQFLVEIASKSQSSSASMDNLPRASPSHSESSMSVPGSSKLYLLKL